MNFETASSILAAIRPARRKRDRYRQRDELQHLLIPHLPIDDRDSDEPTFQALNLQKERTITMNDINTKTYDSDKIIQIIPAPANMFYAFEDGKTYPAACLALVELSNGDHEVHAMAAINGGPIDDMSDTGAVLVYE